MNKIITVLFICLLLSSCSKQENADLPVNNGFLKVIEVKIDEKTITENPKNISLSPEFLINFDDAVNEQSANNAIELLINGRKTELIITYSNNNQSIFVKPKDELLSFTNYTFVIRNILTSNNGKKMNQELSYLITTGIDNKDKYERIDSEALLTKVQRHTFAYFWDFAHPSYGMIRERNTSAEIVTTGGTGFGLMAILVGIERGFITKEQGLERTKNIVSFLQKADTYHGAFSHWYNGSTAKTIAFSTKDNGADLVETSLLFQGLLTTRTYFDDADLNNAITTLYNAVEWNYFRNNHQGLFWHWSTEYSWDMNLKITGWNEALITYILAAGSPTYGIDIQDYEQGWARNGAIKNGANYYNIALPLGSDKGGPLFLSQYTFLGINPFGLEDQYANYELQVKNHALINRSYCIANPKNYIGYSGNCWGLTASDNITGYQAHSPTNDNGVIAPTAALSSIAYTTQESLQALEFFYYKLGDRIFGTYGFKDAFSLDYPWFADSYLAINQGPIIIGIENYRSGLLWNHLMQAPEIKNALIKLKFTSPYL